MQEETSFERKTAVYNPEYNRFILNNPSYSQQYSHIYFRRLNQLDAFLRYPLPLPFPPPHYALCAFHP